jgi:hypothetical protein
MLSLRCHRLLSVLSTPVKTHHWRGDGAWDSLRPDHKRLTAAENISQGTNTIGLTTI